MLASQKRAHKRGWSPACAQPCSHHQHPTNAENGSMHLILSFWASCSCTRPHSERSMVPRTTHPALCSPLCPLQANTLPCLRPYVCPTRQSGGGGHWGGGSVMECLLMFCLRSIVRRYTEPSMSLVVGI